VKKNFIRSLCIMLCAVILVPFAGPAVFSAEAPLSVLVAADCHYKPLSTLPPIGEATGLPGHPLFWHVNIQGQLVYESDAIVNELLARFENGDENFLLLAGDITNNGYLAEHTALSAKLAQFEARTGKSIFVINGNHDVAAAAGETKIDLDGFKTIYADFGYNEALDRHESSASYTAALGRDYRLIAIDSCIYGDDLGEVTQDTLDWVERQAVKATADGKKLVGMMHHSLLEHFKNQGVPGGGNLLIKDYKAIATKFADLGIQYVFTGHVHANDISSAVTAAGNKIYDIETNALIVYPNTYRRVSFSDTGVRVESKYIDTIDPAYLDDGYTPAQLEMIENDFPSFARGFLVTSMQRYISEYVGTPRKVARWLNVAQGTPAYGALENVMAVLGDALRLPIYDRAGTAAIDSLEEIAALAGERIEPGAFEQVSDIVGLLAARHYCGDENTPYDSPEIQIFIQCFKAALVYAFVNIPPAAVAFLLEEIGVSAPLPAPGSSAYSGLTRLIFARTAATHVISTILKPLLESFTVDSFAPGDINVTLEAYGAGNGEAGALVPVNTLQTVTDLARRLIALVFNVIKTFRFV
jgi:3',5'-cyclic AMP phosphodiesterase CpdA